jgi:hypothetical protein
MSAGELDPFNHAISFYVRCEHQAEVDRTWRALLGGGQAEQCGWLRDRYGVAWQIVPRRLPQRRRPCPMCTSLMSVWDGEARDIGQRVSFVMIARPPSERLLAFKRERGWRHLRLYSDPDGAYTRDYAHPEDADVPAYNVFTRRDGTIRHFWSGEMVEGDPGQDPRGAPSDAALDGARHGTDCYSQLNYPE